MSDPERQICCMFTSVWMLAVKSSVNKLQSIEAQWLGTE